MVHQELGRTTERKPLTAHETEVVTTRRIRDSAGKERHLNSRYIEINPGSNYQDPATGDWKEVELTIEQTLTGFEARGGWFEASFAEHTLTDHTFSFTARTGEQFEGRPIGLFYEDTLTGKSVLLSEVKEVPGHVSPDGTIVYPQAFEFGDVVYHIESGKLEQDIIITSRLPHPSEFGLDPDTTLVVALTEFLNSPEPYVNKMHLENQNMEDQCLWFDNVHMGLGKAFVINSTTENKDDVSTAVHKQWRSVGQGALLAEFITYQSYEHLQEIAGIPQSNEEGSDGSNTYARAGVVIDFVTVPSFPHSYTFQSGTTYRIVNNVTINNSVIFQPGSVIKFDRQRSITISGNGYTIFPSSGTAFLTAVDDQTIGEPIPQTDSEPTGTYASSALHLYPGPINGTVRNLQIRYANEGITAYTPYYSVNLQHLTFINCNRAVAGYYTTMYGSSLTFCDVTTEFHNHGSASWHPSGNTNFLGKDDHDGDGLSNFEELVWWYTNPMNAYSMSTTRSDGEYHLAAVTGMSGTRCIVNVTSAQFNPNTGRTDLSFIVSGAYGGERHQMYLWLPSRQLWRRISTQYNNTDHQGDHYTGIAPGNVVGGTFAALLEFVSTPHGLMLYDRDNDFIPDGYELMMTTFIVGNSDTFGHGVEDGEVDIDSDGWNTSQEWLLGSHPMVAESTTDTNGNGLPDWFEEIIVGWFGSGAADPWADPDNDGLPNIVELDVGLIPFIADFGYSNPPPPDPTPPPPYEDGPMFVDLTYSVPYSSNDGPVGNDLFPLETFAAGPLGVATRMQIVPDNPNGSGVAQVIIETFPLHGYLEPNVQTNLLGGFVPAFVAGEPDINEEVQRPDSSDGFSYRSVLIQGTSFADSAWPQVNKQLLSTLNYKTLRYVNTISIIKVSVYSRELQWLKYRQMSPNPSPTLNARMMALTSKVHAEMQIVTAVQYEYRTRFSHESFNYVGKVLKNAAWIGFGFNVLGNYSHFLDGYYWWRGDVKTGIDNSGSEIFSMHIMHFFSSIPAVPPAIQIAAVHFQYSLTPILNSFVK